MNINDLNAIDPKASIKSVARKLNISECKACKIMVSQGYHTNTTHQNIQRLIARGKSRAEICEALHISPSTYHRYTPYTKTIYNLDDCSKNAETIRRFRERQKKS